MYSFVDELSGDEFLPLTTHGFESFLLACRFSSSFYASLYFVTPAFGLQRMAARVPVGVRPGCSRVCFGH